MALNTHPTSAEVKEMVDLYLYFPTAPSRTFLGKTLLLPLRLPLLISVLCLFWRFKATKRIVVEFLLLKMLVKIFYFSPINIKINGMKI